MKKTTVALLIVFVFSTNALAYGPRGHHLVGAIADRRLAGTPTASEISELLDGLTLERVATIPDEIKSWDRCEQSENPSGRIVGASKRINAELRAFVKANSCNSPKHDDFHFTNVPVTGDEEYADGEVGRRDNDIVQMILFCVRVLSGEEPESNDHAITKSVAVILLAHYLGDIHQPLHVAAEFFEAGSDVPIHPTPANKGFGDQGGNKLTLFTLMNGKPRSAGKFHGYWDGQTVENAFGNSPDSTVAKKLANKEPTDWKLTGNVESWGEKLANDILPLAREARTRLEYSKIKTKPGEVFIISGRAEEKKKSGGKFYAIWAADVVKEEIHKGGWRLAALLDEIL